MIMMNLLVSLIGITVERNKENPIKENYKELNKLVVYYEFYSSFIKCCKDDEDDKDDN